MSDLTNQSPEPPEDAKIRLAKAAEESKKLDSPERKNDSTVAPEKSKEEAMRGFHGG